MKIAIVGSGVSGRVAAHLLHREHDTTLFEAPDTVGGHTVTTRVASDDCPLSVDAGFIVYNEANYPNFVRLLDRLGVETQATSMSFGRHYETTALAWLDNMDRRLDEIREIFQSVYGSAADRWIQRWRLFFLACAELFAADQGREWYVSHSLWRRRPAPSPRPGGAEE